MGNSDGFYVTAWGGSSICALHKGDSLIRDSTPPLGRLGQRLRPSARAESLAHLEGMGVDMSLGGELRCYGELRCLVLWGTAMFRPPFP